MPLLGLIGYPLAHSFSPEYFKQKFEHLKISNWQYKAFPITEIHLLPDLLGNNPDLIGLNVTIPYKTEVLPYCDTLSPEVIEIGAANLILIDRNAPSDLKIKAYNTDAYGFYESLIPWYKHKGNKSLIMGTGGVSKAVQYVLKSMDIPFDIVSRTGKLTYAELEINQYGLLINCTPIGTLKENSEKESFLPLDYAKINKDMYFYDMVYNPQYTDMMAAFEIKGAQVKNGLEMLHLQADKTWEICSK
jgi:shikimate dehydrogenase